MRSMRWCDRGSTAHSCSIPPYQNEIFQFQSEALSRLRSVKTSQFCDGQVWNFQKLPEGGSHAPPPPPRLPAVKGRAVFARLTFGLLFTFFVLRDRPDQFLFRCYGPDTGYSISSIPSFVMKEKLCSHDLQSLAHPLRRGPLVMELILWLSSGSYTQYIDGLTALLEPLLNACRNCCASTFTYMLSQLLGLLASAWVLRLACFAKFVTITTFGSFAYVNIGKLGSTYQSMHAGLRVKYACLLRPQAACTALIQFKRTCEDTSSKLTSTDHRAWTFKVAA